MKLYTNNKGAWTGTLADAKRDYGKAIAMIEVPTSKEALMKWLNRSCVISQASVAVAGFIAKKDDAVDVIPPAPRETTTTPNVWDVQNAVLLCDRKHLGHALASIISRLHDEMAEEEA